jgi:hypothetical protein
MSGYSNPSPPRPIEQQMWRRHHTGRTALGVDFYDADWSETSGCQRRRAKAILRRQWVFELLHAELERRVSA